MARLPDVDRNASPETADAFARTEASRGFVSNLLRTMLHSPKSQRAHAAYGHAMRFGVDLTEIQRELVICATVRNVHYGWAHHSGLLLQLGISDQQLAALKAGKVPPGLSPADQVLCSFVFAFTTHAVTDTLFAELRKHFTNCQVVDISLLSAYFIGGGAMITAFDVQVEPPAIIEVELGWQRKRLSGEVKT
jgi:4-carboxymuconolactone decarboxylase